MTCFAVFASSGAALAACPTQSVSTPFSQFGDTNSYFVAPGGSFDGSAGGWTLNNASYQAANDGFNLGGAAQPGSLQINAGGSATSPYFCVDRTITSFRFVTQEVTGGSNLKVSAIVQGWGGTSTIPVADLADGSSNSTWAPSPALSLGSIPPGQTVQMALRFSVPQSSGPWGPQSSGAWGIDDVFIDPFRMG